MTKRFDKDGELESEIYTLPDTNESCWKTYHKGKGLKSVFYEKDGKPVSFREYYESGKIMLENEWDDVSKLVLKKEYDQVGKLIRDYSVSPDSYDETLFGDSFFGSDEEVFGVGKREGFLVRIVEFFCSFACRK